MKICNFTQSELDIFRDECNFTDIESQCFEMKAKNYTDVQIASELHIAEPTVAVTMRRIRSKITTVLNSRPLHRFELPYQSSGCGKCIVSKTMEEWARTPDFLSSRGTLYIYEDYRTENDVNIPRIKIGDGLRSLSELPFATMSITDKDMEYWDNKPDTEDNHFGKIIEIQDSTDYFTFPTDGYVMLEFESAKEFAKVNIYGANGQSFFEFEKRPDIDIHSKEVFVKRGMKCLFQSCSDNAKIRFIPLV